MTSYCKKIKMAAATISRNFPFIKQQAIAAFNNSSVMVKILCLAVTIGYFLSFSERTIDLLSITPGYFMPPSFRIWNVLTFFILENRLWQVVTDAITVILCGKLIEPLWGKFETLIFFSIVNVTVGVVCVVYYLFLYMATSNPEVLFGVHIHGLAGYLAGVSVAVKQIMPEHVLLSTPLGKLKNRNVPLSVFLVSVILWVIGALRGTYPCMFGSGIFSSWIYLRFFQHHSNGTRGDMAEGFTFASFFPNVLQPPVAVFSNTAYELMIKMKLCKRPIKRYDMSAPSSITVTLPGTDPHDAERRRQIALKALNERLTKQDAVPSPNDQWPNLVDDEAPSSATPSVDGSTEVHASNVHAKPSSSQHSSVPATDKTKTSTPLVEPSPPPGPSTVV